MRHVTAETPSLTDFSLVGRAVSACLAWGVRGVIAMAFLVVVLGAAAGSQVAPSPAPVGEVASCAAAAHDGERVTLGQPDAADAEWCPIAEVGAFPEWPLPSFSVVRHLPFPQDWLDAPRLRPPCTQA